MIGLLCFVLAALASPFKSKMRLEAENVVLRHQSIVLRRRLRGRVQLTNNDRWFFIQLYRWLPSILQVLTIIRSETLVRWHRAGFRCYWRWKSRPLGGRSQIEIELRVLIRRMSVENPLWGAPRNHGELLKLGFEIAQASVAKYMVKRRGPPSQGWRTFLRNHTPNIAAMDLLVVPTIGFDLLYAFVVFRLDRRNLVWINVTANPTAKRIAYQLTEAFPWNEAPRYMIRDRDRIYGAPVTRRLRAMGIRDKPTAPASPWQNRFAERLIGSIRRVQIRRWNFHTAWTRNGHADSVRLKRTPLKSHGTWIKTELQSTSDDVALRAHSDMFHGGVDVASSAFQSVAFEDGTCTSFGG